MKVLITGASGFIGSFLCREMVSRGHDVRILVRPTSILKRLRGLRVTSVLGDVTNAESVRMAVGGCEWVIHAAADLNYWEQNPDWQMKVNVEGTINIAQACRAEGVGRLLHVSSVAAVGIPNGSQSPVNEDFNFNLKNSRLTYYISKRLAEDGLMGEIDKGLNAVIVNPASVTGPERLAKLISSVRRRPVVPCFSGGNCVVHVADVVDGIVAALEHGRTGHRYILGGENLTFRAMGEKAARAMNLSRLFVSIPPFITGLAAAVLEPWSRWRNRPPRVSYMIHYCANRFLFYSSHKASRELNYRPRGFDTLLKDTLYSGTPIE